MCVSLCDRTASSQTNPKQSRGRSPQAKNPIETSLHPVLHIVLQNRWISPDCVRVAVISWCRESVCLRVCGCNYLWLTLCTSVVNNCEHTRLTQNTFAVNTHRGPNVPWLRQSRMGMRAEALQAKKDVRAPTWARCTSCSGIHIVQTTKALNIS